MASILDAINAAAAKLNSEKPKAQPKSEQKAKAKAKSAPKSDSPKTSGNVKYVIPASFKQAIEDYLDTRTDLAEKMKQKDKSIDGCCDYLFKLMLKRAKKVRKSEIGVGMCEAREEIFGLAVHYYCESNESLEKELKSE